MCVILLMICVHVLAYFSIVDFSFLAVAGWIKNNNNNNNCQCVKQWFIFSHIQFTTNVNIAMSVSTLRRQMFITKKPFISTKSYTYIARERYCSYWMLKLFYTSAFKNLSKDKISHPSWKDLHLNWNPV